MHLSVDSPSLSSVYGSHVPTQRTELWYFLRCLTPNISGSWILARDFNFMQRPNDKKGGVPLSLAATRDFNTCINDCELIELETRGPYFTWERAGTLERID